MLHSRGPVAVVSLVLLVSCEACDSSRATERRPDSSSRGATQTTPPPAEPAETLTRVGWLEIRMPAPPRTLLGVAPENLLAARRARYRLQPDRRVLYAAAEIHRLFREDASRIHSMRVRFEDGAWHVQYEDEDVGRLPEIPTWEESRTFLAAWVARIAPPPTPLRPTDESTLGPLRRTLFEGSAPEVATALARLEGLWREAPGDAELLRLACGGLAWLQIQTHDPLERTDPLLGHTLALLTVAGHGGADVRSEEALLATEMGYGAAAAKVGRTLPENDAVRLFVMHDGPGLLALAQRTRDRRAEYLALVRLAEAGDVRAWDAFRSRSHWSGAETPPVLHAALLLGDFATTTDRAHRLFLAAAEEAGVVASAPSALPPEARLKEFEANLERRRAQPGHALFDGDSASSVIRANAYGGLYEIVAFALDTWSATEAARSFAATISDPPRGTAEELVRWTGDRIAVREGTLAGKARALADVAGFRDLGSKPTSRLRSTLRYSAANPVDPNLRRPIPGFFAGLDTRPAHLLEAGWTAWDSLIDLARGERFLRASVSMAPQEAGRYLPWCALRARDANELRRIADRRDLRESARAVALEGLASLAGPASTDRSFLESRYRTILREAREDTTTLFALVGLLERSGEIGKADLTIQQFLANRSRNGDLLWAGVEARRASLLRRAGRFHEAWSAIEPTLTTGKEDCLEEGARTLVALGETGRGRNLALQSLERYPESGSSAALVAELDWRAGAYADAAKVLAASDRNLTDGDWRTEVGVSFVRVFKEKPVEEPVKAFEELRRAIPHAWRLGNIALSLGLEGAHEAAFRMLASLGGQGADAMGVLLGAYGEAVKARGSAEALAWLRERVPSGDPGNSLLLAAFQEGHHELLWDLWDGKRPANVEVLEALRGYSLYLSKIESGPRLDELLAYWQAHASSDFAPQQIYLLGAAGRDPRLFSKLRNVEDLASVAWTVGLRAAREKRYDEASEWFQVALEVGNERMAPSTWAWMFLTNWRAEDVFLSTVAARKMELPFQLGAISRPSANELAASGSASD